MTNGEKLCIDFPNMRYTISEHRVITTIGVAASFDLDWWNAEYKEPSSPEIPTDSIIDWNNCHTSKQLESIATTKNNLGVDKEQLKTMIRGLTKWYVKRDNTEVGEPDTAVGLLYDDVMFGIDRLPSVPQEPRWIPVSERLPKIADVYRVTRYYPNNVMNPNYLVDACFFDGSNTWYNDNRINHERAYADNVIAWQENPEPYKAYSEEEE